MKHHDNIAEITMRSVLPEFPSSVTIVIPRQKSSLSLRSAHTTGLVPATGPCNTSQGQVPSCELAIFATKSCRGD